MKFYLVMILAIVFLPFTAYSNADTTNYTEQFSETNNTSLLNSQKISDPRVKIIDFEGKPTSTVLNEKTNTVSVIDSSSNKTIDSIPVGEAPRRIVVNVQTNTIYVTNQGTSDISVMDGNSKETIETIQVQSHLRLQ